MSLKSGTKMLQQLIKTNAFCQRSDLPQSIQNIFFVTCSHTISVLCLQNGCMHGEGIPLYGLFA